jgi:CYTH domain-containing protein
MMEKLEIERKWLVPGEVRIPGFIEYKTYRIAQMYLLSEKRERLRIIHDNLGDRFIHTIKRPAAGGGNWEWERELSVKEFYDMTARIDPECRILTKERVEFWVAGKKWELDKFIYPVSFQILEVELSGFDERVTIPSFIEKSIEVTNIKGFSNKRIASKPDVAVKKAESLIMGNVSF